MSKSNQAKKPIISIITVVFNGADTLRATIESIVPQLTEEVEYIIIDGDSTDGTNEIIEKYSRHIDHWISEPDEGIYDAMNKGLKIAAGEFVWFLNAGDEISDDTVISDLLTSISSNINYIYSGTHLIEGSGSIIKTTSSPMKLSKSMMTSGMHISHQSFIARIAIAPPYDMRYKLVADQKWVIDCVQYGKECGLRFNRPISRYLMGGISEIKATECILEKMLMTMSNYPVYFIKNLPKYIFELFKAKFKTIISSTEIMQNYRV